MSLDTASPATTTVVGPAPAHRPRLMIGMATAAALGAGAVVALVVAFGGSAAPADATSLSDHEVGQYGSVAKKDADAAKAFGGQLP